MSANSPICGEAQEPLLVTALELAKLLNVSKRTIHRLRSAGDMPQAKELARHSDVNMTMRYTHIGIEDQAKAVANLPAPKGRPAEPASRAAQRNPSALQMRCIFCSAKGHSVTSAGNGQKVQKRQNPWQAKGFDNDRRQVSPPDKVEAAGIE